MDMMDDADSLEKIVVFLLHSPFSFFPSRVRLYDRKQIDLNVQECLALRAEKWRADREDARAKRDIVNQLKADRGLQEFRLIYA